MNAGVVAIDHATWQAITDWAESCKRIRPILCMILPSYVMITVLAAYGINPIPPDTAICAAGCRNRELHGMRGETAMRYCKKEKIDN